MLHAKYSTAPFLAPLSATRLPSDLTAIVLVGAALLASAPASALEYKLSAGFSTTHSDNIARASDDSGLKQDDWIHTPMVRGNLSHATSRLRADANYMVEHRIYTEDVFDDRTRWTGLGNLQWDAVPGLLQLNASNSRTEATEDALGQDVENNRQITTVTSAGPRLLLQPRTSDEFSLEFRYSDINQEQTNSDSERQYYAASYKFGFSTNRSLTIAASHDQVEFERADAPELDIDTASLTYTSKGDTLDIEARGGYTTIDRSLGRDKVDGVIGNLNLLWRTSGSGEFSINARRNINDQSDDVLRGIASFGQGSVGQNTNINEVFIEDIVRINYTHRWGRNTARIGYDVQNWNFKNAASNEAFARDQDQSGINLYYARRLTPTLNVQLNANFSERDFKERGRKEDFMTSSLRVDWRAGQRLTLFAGASYEDRDGTSPDLLVDFLSFEELRFNIGMNIDLVSRVPLARQPQRQNVRRRRFQ